MASRKPTDTLKDQTRDKNPRYLQMFPRSFVNSYGRALGRMPDTDVLKRLHPWNCEWLNRPRVAISELAQTISENLLITKKYQGTIFTDKAVDKLFTKFRPVKDALARFDNKDRSSDEQPTEDDVRKFMKIVQEDRNLEEHVQQLFEASGAMFLLSTHLQAAQVLLWNPTEYAEKLPATRLTERFKQDPTQIQMRDFLYTHIASDTKGGDRDYYEGKKGALWDQTRTPTRPPTRRVAKGRPSTATTTSGALEKYPARRLSFWDDEPTSSTTRTPKQTSTTGGSHRKSGNYDLDDDDQEGSPLVQDTPSPEFSSEESEDENQPLATAKRYKRRSTQKLPIIATSDEDEHDEEVEEQDEYRIEEDQEEHALFITQDKFLEYPTTGYEQDFQPPAKRNRTEPKLKIPPVTGQRAIKPRTASETPRGAARGRGSRGRAKPSKPRATTQAVQRGRGRGKNSAPNKHIFFK